MSTETRRLIDKKELLKLAFAYFGLFVVFLIAFYKEPIFNLVKITGGIFWLYVIPGYFLTLYLADRFDMFYRVIFGVAFNMAVLLLVSYYLGIAGVHIKYHIYFLPIVIIIAGIFLANHRRKKSPIEQSNQKSDFNRI